VPLPVEPPVFAALPVGALLDGQRYEVTAILNEGTKLNAYHVVDHRERHCSQCGSQDNAPDEKYCANCGMALPDSPATYLMRETSEPDMWEGERLIAERKLWHKGLVNVYRIFSECPYGGISRFYLVTDQEEGESLAALPRPQPEEKTLLWGQQLAEVLAYLHNQGLRHRAIRSANVRLIGNQVKLTNFGRTEKVRKIEGKDWPAEEVAELARMLREDLLAGQELSPAVVALFEKALSSDKSARYMSAESLAADIAKTLEALHQVKSVALVVGRHSHVGVVRDHNEDCLITLEVQHAQLSENRPLGLYVVADGMGGHEAGEIASGLAVSAVARVIANNLMLPWMDGKPPTDYEALLKEAFQEANKAVHDRRRSARTDMGTTLVGALIVGTEAFIANIGDSRCYHLNKEEFRQITVDHSLVERLVATGQINREEARVHPQRNYIYRTVGDKPQVEVDTFKVSLKPGDYLLLCSDGLNSMLEDEQIWQAVLDNPHPQSACEELIRLANAAGGDDNITAIVIQVLEISGARFKKLS
jgi:protein phosphatase